MGKGARDRASELRKKAFMQYKKMKPDAFPYPQDDMKTLIQELQIHQIELEMQNEEMQRVNSENEYLKNKYFELYELAPAGYLTLDRYGKIFEMNLTASLIFNIERSLMTGKKFTFYIDPLYFDIFNKSINAARNAKTSQSCIVKSRIVNNAVKHIQLEIVPDIDENGEVEKLYMAAIDVSVIKLAEEEIIKAKKSEELSNAKSLFVANINHELRTPMVTVLGYSKILMGDNRLSEDQLEKIAIIQKNGGILLKLINDLLDMSRVETGKIRINQLPFKLPDMLTDIVETIGFQAKEKNLKFILDVTTEIPVLIIGDEFKLRQVILNLLNNAVKFTEKGKVVLRVSARSFDKLHFEIEDEGIGIEPGQMKKIFEPFYQTVYGTQSKTRGFGLGLAISRQFIRLMGSDIIVKSEPGKGSLFSFDINFGAFEDKFTSFSLKSGIKTDKKTRPGKLPAPGPNDIKELQGMARSGDIMGIRRYIKRVSAEKPELLPFTDYLNKLAAKIDLKGIMELLSSKEHPG